MNDWDLIGDAKKYSKFESRCRRKNEEQPYEPQRDCIYFQKDLRKANINRCELVKDEYKCNRYCGWKTTKRGRQHE